MQVPDTLANTARALHDLGLAAWVGGSLFGKLALNPAVRTVSDKSDRGKVVNTAWNGYNLVNTASLGAVTIGWFAARLTEANPLLTSTRENKLSLAKDALVLGSVVSGVANGIQGGRLAKQAPDGAVPIESGTQPATETPRQAATIQKSLGVLGNLNILLGVALVVVNAILAQTNYSRPPLRRGILRRNK